MLGWGARIPAGGYRAPQGTFSSHYTKVEFSGVYISPTCYPDGKEHICVNIKFLCIVPQSFV